MEPGPGQNGAQIETLERIAQAAIKMPDGEILKGASYDAIMIEFMETNGTIPAERIYGFITSTGRFVTLKEGPKIAFAAGQTDRIMERLYPEDLKNT